MDKCGFKGLSIFHRQDYSLLHGFWLCLSLLHGVRIWFIWANVASGLLKPG
jgi:hypothetical protein